MSRILISGERAIARWSFEPAPSSPTEGSIALGALSTAGAARVGPPAYHTPNASPDRRRLVTSEMTQDAF